MRVAMSSFRFNHQGGIERASYELARGLADSGLDVTLVANAVDPPAIAPLSWHEVPMPSVPGFMVAGVFPDEPPGV